MGQVLIHHTAQCFDCGASCAARNAQAWATNHANHHGHAVEVSLGYRVTPNPGMPANEKGRPD